MLVRFPPNQKRGEKGHQLLGDLAAQSQVPACWPCPRAPPLFRGRAGVADPAARRAAPAAASPAQSFRFFGSKPAPTDIKQKGLGTLGTGDTGNQVADFR